MPTTTASDDLVEELVAGGLTLSSQGLVTAFGHLSVRLGPGELLLTPPEPLGRLSRRADFTAVDVAADELAPSVPKEAWIHLEIARRRPDVAAICRAQPPIATALAAADVPILALHGQGAFVGAVVPVFDDAVLVRDQERAGLLAERLGESTALVLRGNGAVTVGANIGEAVARMWVLEASARMNSVAASAGRPRPLSDHEQEQWRAVAPEILGRIWRDLRASAEASLHNDQKGIM